MYSDSTIYSASQYFEAISEKEDFGAVGHEATGPEAEDDYGPIVKVKDIDCEGRPLSSSPHTADEAIRRHVTCAFECLLQKKLGKSTAIKSLTRAASGNKKDDCFEKLMDEYHTIMAHVDIMVEFEGLREKDPSGATPLRWEFGLKPNFMFAFGDSETNKQAMQIANTAIWEWCQIRPCQGLESFYLSGGMYTTNLGDRPNEVVMFTISMLDKKFMPMLYRRYDRTTGLVLNPHTHPRPHPALQELKMSVTPKDKRGRFKPVNLVSNYDAFLKVTHSRGGKSRLTKLPIIGRFWAKADEEKERYLTQKCRAI